MKTTQPAALCAGHGCDMRKACDRHEVFDMSEDPDITATGRLCGPDFEYFIPAEEISA